MVNSIITTLLACLILALGISLTISVLKYKKWKRKATFDGTFDSQTNAKTKKRFQIIIWTLTSLIVVFAIGALIFSFVTTFNTNIIA